MNITHHLHAVLEALFIANGMYVIAADTNKGSVAPPSNSPTSI